MNNSAYNVTDISVWDTLPANLTYQSSQSSVVPVLLNNVLTWNMPGYMLAAGSQIVLEFWVSINAIIPGDLIETKAWADYYDPHYVPAVGRHPPVSSSAHYYPEDMTVVFPNPFNPATAVNHSLKFLNVIPGSLIIITTLSGEFVVSKNVSMIREEWDGKNSRGMAVSPGIYYYIINNMQTNQKSVGKIFIVSK